MARRSHPPTALKLAERMIRDRALLGRGDRVLCATSGGPDSTALLHVLAWLQKRLGHVVEAMGIDHGLRPEAAEELNVARQVSESLDVPFHHVRLAVAAGSNLQARARDARHAALQRCATEIGARSIALGHTANDRAETLLLRLLRGSGPRGLGVMPPRAPGIAGEVPLIRPLLMARRSDVLAHLARHHLPHADDPSNVDRRFLRARVRHELIPLLEDLSPQIVPHLCALAEMIGPEAHVLDDFGRAQRQLLENTIREGLRGKAKAVTLRLRDDRELLVQFRKRGRSRADDGSKTTK